MNESRMLAVMGDALGASLADRIESSMHAQHGVSVLVGLERELAVRDSRGKELRGRVVIVPADVEHAVRSEGPMVGLLYDIEVFGGIDGYARDGGARVLEHECPVADAPGFSLLGGVRSNRASLERPDVLEGLGREAALRARGRGRRIDRRVARVLEALRSPEVTRDELLAIARVSDEHLQSLFARDVGIPIRTYRLWARLMKACAALRTTDATTAAHLAGFSDLAHLSRTCRRMLGHSPSQMRIAFLAVRRPFDPE